MVIFMSSTVDTRRKFSRKVCIIGVGYVGASIAYALKLKEIAHEIVLIDKDISKAEAELMDLRHGISYMGSAIIRVGDFSDISGADLIVVTAGLNRKPDQSRLDLAADNIKITKDISLEIQKYYTTGVVLIVSNPNDVLTFKMNQWLGLPRGMVFGTGCTLDEARFASVVADYLNVKPNAVISQVIGEHGDTQVPLWSKTSVTGVPIVEYCNAIDINFGDEERVKIEETTRKMAASIIRGKQRTHYGIASCMCFIADAVLSRRATVLCVTSTLDGEYGLKNVALSVPTVVDHMGASRRLEESITDLEFSRLRASADAVRAVIDQMP
jgi:L-lactate dehydrogenase